MLHAAWVIPAIPLFGFAVLILAGRRLGDPGAGWFATAMAAGAFAFALIVFVGLGLIVAIYRRRVGATADDLDLLKG